jgi:hypothetical protein
MCKSVAASSWIAINLGTIAMLWELAFIIPLTIRDLSVIMMQNNKTDDNLV